MKFETWDRLQEVKSEVKISKFLKMSVKNEVKFSKPEKISRLRKNTMNTFEKNWLKFGF